MLTSKYRPRAGDWFAIPLEGEAVALGYAAVVTPGDLIMAYLFAVDAGALEDRVWQRLGPEDALTAVVTGVRGLTSGHWRHLAHAEPADSWPDPEFERETPTAHGARLHAVAKAANLVNDRTSVEIPAAEKGRRPPDRVFGFKNVAPFVQQLIARGALPMSQQPWWAGVAARPSAGHGPRQYDTVLLRLDPDMAGDLPSLLDELARGVQEDGDVDGSVVGADGITVFLYGVDGSSLASTVRKVLARLEVAASVSVRPAHGD